jgi:hypothetical protein
MAFIEIVRAAAGNGLALVCGYNSSSGIQPPIGTMMTRPLQYHLGYDLPWILSRLVCKTSAALTGYCKMFGAARGSSTHRVNLFGPRVIFADARTIATEYCAAAVRDGTIKHVPRTYSLESALEALGLDSKEAHGLSHSQMGAIMRERCTVMVAGCARNIDDVLAYCVRDSVAVADILRVSKYLMCRLSFAQLTRTPMYMALGQTDAACLNWYIARELHDAGFDARYEFAGYSGGDSGRYKGAITLAKPGLGRNALMFDFMSLYPTCIRAYGISAERFAGFSATRPDEDIAAGRMWAVRNDPNTYLGIDGEGAARDGAQALWCPVLGEAAREADCVAADGSSWVLFDRTKVSPLVNAVDRLWFARLAAKAAISAAAVSAKRPAYERTADDEAAIAKGADANVTSMFSRSCSIPSTGYSELRMRIMASRSDAHAPSR